MLRFVPFLGAISLCNPGKEDRSFGPAVKIDAPSNGDVFTEGDEIEFLATAKGEDAANISWAWTEDGAVLTGTQTGGLEVSFIPDDTFGVGTHSVRVTVTDPDGLSGYDVVDFTVEPAEESFCPEDPTLEMSLSMTCENLGELAFALPEQPPAGRCRWYPSTTTLLVDYNNGASGESYNGLYINIGNFSGTGSYELQYDEDEVTESMTLAVGYNAVSSDYTFDPDTGDIQDGHAFCRVEADASNLGDAEVGAEGTICLDISCDLVGVGNVGECGGIEFSITPSCMVVQ